MIHTNKGRVEGNGTSNPTETQFRRGRITGTKPLHGPLWTNNEAHNDFAKPGASGERFRFPTLFDANTRSCDGGNDRHERPSPDAPEQKIKLQAPRAGIT